jgi:DNA-binding NtrC family response regulator
MTPLEKPAGVKTDLRKIIEVLAVEPDLQDRLSLGAIFMGSQWALCPDEQLNLHLRPTAASGIEALREHRAPVVLCDCDQERDGWKKILAELDSLEERPFLIVTSTHADERLWAEALNLGAYDVLAKPFDSAEVVRVVSLAWMHWRERQTALTGPPPLKLAAGM